MAKAGLTSLDLQWDIYDTTEQRTWAEIGKENLSEIGINVTINPQPYDSMIALGQGDKGKGIELYSDDFAMAPDPAWATEWFTCEQVGKWNWMRWCNSDYGALNDKAMVTLDETERTKIYIQMQQIWDEACISLFVTNGVASFAYKPTIKPAVSPHGVFRPCWFTPAQQGVKLQAQSQLSESLNRGLCL